jgi:hypothetical protein
MYVSSRGNVGMTVIYDVRRMSQKVVNRLEILGRTKEDFRQLNVIRVDAHGMLQMKVLCTFYTLEMFSLRWQNFGKIYLK